MTKPHTSDYEDGTTHLCQAPQMGLSSEGLYSVQQLIGTLVKQVSQKIYARILTVDQAGFYTATENRLQYSGQFIPRLHHSIKID